jgi:hypothetical protein
MDARVAPEGSFEILSRQEVNQLRDAGAGGLYDLRRQCTLAVLNAGAEEDDIRKNQRRNEGYTMSVVRQEGGIALELQNAPSTAFVNGQMIRGVKEHLFAVLRDLLYAHLAVLTSDRFDMSSSR